MAVPLGSSEMQHVQNDNNRVFNNVDDTPPQLPCPRVGCKAVLRRNNEHSGNNAAFLKVKAGGIYSHHCVVCKGLNSAVLSGR